MPTPTGGIVGQRRWYYPALAAPGIAWLLLLFILPFYAIAAVAFGGRDLIFGLPIPAWNPLEWQYETFSSTAAELFSSSGLQAQFLRTLAYVGDLGHHLLVRRLSGRVLHRSLRRAAEDRSCSP